MASRLTALDDTSRHRDGSPRRPRDRRSWRLLAVVLLGSSLLLAPRRALASPDDSWDGRFYANGTVPIDGVVNAIAVSGGNVYVGGFFTSIFGVKANNIARWDGTTWSALGTGTGGGGGNPAVYALAVSGSDLYVGGAFSTAGGVSANKIAKWNGTSWSALGTGMNANVLALAASGSAVYAGGEFTTAGGSGANRTAQWNGTTWSALGTGMNSTVLALAVSGSTLYAGGEFTTAGGSSANRIAQWDGASWTSLGTGMDNRVKAVTVNGTDLYAGGAFTSAGGVAANRVARWDGATWSALGSGLSGPADALAFAGGDLYAMGGFSSAGGTPVQNVARWNGTSWSSLAGGGPGLWNAGPAALAGSGTDLYVGGQFIGAAGTAATSIARWNGSAWSLATPTPGAGIAAADYYPGVRALARSASGDLYAGGVFEFAGTTPAVSIAKFDGTGWSALGTGLEGSSLSNYFHGVALALAFYNGDLIVGGNFTTAGGVTVNHIASWNGSSFAALGSGVGGGQITVNALAVYNGELYAGGSFSGVIGVPGTANIARWNGSSWSPVGSGTNGTVYTFAMLGSDLYVGGEFTAGGGGPGNYVARWNGTSWSAVGSGPGSAPNSLAAVGSDLYAGGGFPNGSAIVKWDGATWSIPGGGICWFCGFGGHYVNSLASSGTDLYLGGSFDHVGPGNSIAANGIVKWDGVNWSALGSGMGGCVGSSCGGGAGPMLIAGTDLYVGGRFTTAGDKPASFLSIWHTCGNGVVDANEQCDDGNTTSGDCCSSTCQYEPGGGPCPGDGNPCTNDQCNGTGGCTHPPNTAPCDDGLFCNGTDVCSGGTCTHSGDPCPGPDGDANCSESCDEATDSCTAPDPNGSACNDGLFCNGADHCSSGACVVHAGDPCPGPDGDANCAESCDEATDSCTAPDPNGSACNDGLFCNGADTCGGGACSGHTGDPCVGGPECNNVCDETLDSCALPASTPCTSDGNGCTDDHCNGAGSCAHTNNTAPCDDGTFCNGTDTCAGGACTHSGNPCSGGPECAHTCNEAADNCFDPAGTTCTADTNQCTLDQCNGAGACSHPNVTDGATCNDGDPCTTGEVCTGGVCGGGTPVGCTTTTTSSTTTTTFPGLGHLKCYKGKDARPKASYGLDLVPGAGTNFPLQLGCVLHLGAGAICVEVDKQNVNPPPPGGGPTIPPNAGSVFLSYKVKCPKQGGPQDTDGDQFGTGFFIGSTVSRLLVPALPGPANDHFECFKTKDTRPKATYTMNLLAGVAGFSNETGCRVKLGAKEICAQVTKQAVTPPPPGGGPGPGPGSGARFIAYNLKCPKGAVVPPFAFGDQFGAGTFAPATPKTLLVPAQGTTTTSASTTTTTTTIPVTSPPPAGLAQWNKADAGVTVDGSNNVLLWSDQSGNGRDWGIGNGFVQWVPAAQNGLPVVRAGGSSNYLTTAAYFSGTQEAEVLVVIRSNRPGSEVNYAWGGFGNDGSVINHYPWYASTIYETFGHTTRQGPISVANNGDATRAYGIYDVSAGTGSNNYVLRLNGTQLGTTTGSPAWHPSTFYLFSYWFNQNYQFLGDIGELLVYDHVLSPADRATAYAYLKQRWGTPDGL